MPHVNPGIGVGATSVTVHVFPVGIPVTVAEPPGAHSHPTREPGPTVVVDRERPPAASAPSGLSTDFEILQLPRSRVIELPTVISNVPPLVAITTEAGV